MKFDWQAVSLPIQVELSAHDCLRNICDLQMILIAKGSVALQSSCSIAFTLF